MMLQKWNPSTFAPLRTLDSDISSLVDLLPSWGVSRAFAPAVDLIETADEIILEADMPGLQPSDIEVKVENGTLRVYGKRTKEKSEHATTYYLYERSYGEFARSVALPETVDSENVTARYQNGVLTVTLPKREEAKPKPIKIDVA